MKSVVRIFFLYLFLCSGISLYAQTYFSVQTHFGQIDRPDIDSSSINRMLDGIQAAGIKVIRDECYWSFIETQRGVFSFSPVLDYYIRTAKQKGIDVMLILDYNNPLYAPHAGAAVTSDSNRAAYAQYCRKVVERYAPLGVKLYEIWNEPNIPQFWDPSPSALQYKQLLQAAYPVIKSVDSTVTVLGCATSPAEGNPAPYISWLSFITQVFNAGGGAFMDAVSFHLYRVDKAPESYLYIDITNLKSIAGAKPVYLTEIGYPTSSVWPNVPQAKQAEYLARTYLLGTKIPELKMISWYDYKNDGEDPANNEHNFGIVNFDYSPKPAYTYYKTLRNNITGKTYSSSGVNNGAYSFAFGDALSSVWAFWHETGTSTLQYNFGQARIFKVVASTGEAYFIHDRDGFMPVKYSTSPVYYGKKDRLPENTFFEIRPFINTVVVNQKVNFFFRGLTPDGTPVIVDSSLVVWSVTTGNGEIDSLGRFRALSSGLCRVKGIYNLTEYTHSFTIEPAYTNLEIEPFNSYSQFSISFLNMLDTIDVVSTTDSSFTTPPSSLLFKYRFRYQGIDKHRIYLDSIYTLLGEPDTIMIDIYGNGNGHVINFRIEDADGQIFTVNTSSSALINQYGWKTIKAPLNKFGSTFNFPAKLTRITVYTVKSGGTVDSVYSGNILLDNLRIHNGIVSGVSERTAYKRDHELLSSVPFPNPFGTGAGYSDNKIKLRLNNIPGNNCEAILFDITGKLIWNGSFEINNGSNGILIDADKINLSSGIYFYRLSADDQTVYGKIAFLR